MESSMLMEAVAQKPTTPTWKDFTLEEHMRGHVGIPAGCTMVVKKLFDSVYRINVIHKGNDEFVKSVAVKVITTPEGYVFQEWPQAQE